MENIGFELRLSADEELIRSPDDPVVALLAAWKTQYDLQLARNMPLLLLTNTSERASAEITGMSMTIGREGYNFDWVQTIDTSPGVDVTLNLVDSVEGGLRADRFELELAGLGPGGFVLLRLDIDPNDDAAFQLPDYRTVLFEANGDGSGDNAAIEVVFDDPQAVQATTLGGRLEDYAVDEPLFVGPAFHAYEQTDHVHVFRFGRTEVMAVGQTVPEPSAMVLTVAVALAVASMHRFRRPAGR